jgi:adenylate cyclase
MATEIERKFLVRDTSVLRGVRGERILQGYLSCGRVTLRVRHIGACAYLTLKGPSAGLTRDEFEYEIPAGDADQLLARYCEPGRVAKVRYRVPYRGHEFEVDVFEGHLTGLVMAEVELEDEQQPLELPPWIGREVSHDPRYYNAALARAAGPPIEA